MATPSPPDPRLSTLNPRPSIPDPRLPTPDSRLACFLAAALLAGAARGQVFERPTVLPPAEVEQLDAGSMAHLENARRFLAEKQWGEAVEAIRRVQEADPTRLVRVDLALPLSGFERYVTAAEYCQWRLAELATEAPEALAHYRRLVDPLAEAWLREGTNNNDERLLERVVQQAFASRWGDDALLKLGDLALARGDPKSARAAWQRINSALSVPPSAADGWRAPVGSPLWLALRRFDFARHGRECEALLSAPGTPPPGTYPDTDLDLAAVRARLVLASIFEGSRERAAVELAILRLLHPGADGQLAGRRGRYTDLLGSLLEESAGWPAPKQSPDWPTIGGDNSRAKIFSREVDLAGRPRWSFPLPRLVADRESIGAGRVRVADDAKSLLSYHPIVIGQQVLLRVDARGQSHAVALDLKSGTRLWQVDYNRGLVSDTPGQEQPSDKPWELSDAHAGLSRQAGVARYTLTALGSKVFARMGSPITVPRALRAAQWLAKDQGFLLGLDLATQGKPLEGFPIHPPANDWTFEGTPLADEGTIYVVMRRVEGGHSQLYLAAFELQTTALGQADDQGASSRPTGRLKWRTRVCSSTTLGGGELDQLTHLLVTLAGGRVYLNTSAGVVAAVSATDGQLLWLVKYPRSGVRTGNPDQPEQHLFRDLTPCLAWKDLVIVAPADCDRVFAVEGATGQLVWALPPGAADDVVHLLGAAQDVLLASGHALYWIDANTGRLLTQFPRGALGGADQAPQAPRGLGRGLLAGSHVWWPTRESIFVFEVRPATTDFGHQPRLVREIPLVPRGVTGGNLVLADGVLLIATGDKLVAFDEVGSRGDARPLQP